MFSRLLVFKHHLFMDETSVVRIMRVTIRLVRFELIQPVAELNRRGESEIKKDRTCIADLWDESLSSLDCPSMLMRKR